MTVHRRLSSLDVGINSHAPKVETLRLLDDVDPTDTVLSNSERGLDNNELWQQLLTAHPATPRELDQLSRISRMLNRPFETIFTIPKPARALPDLYRDDYKYPEDIVDPVTGLRPFKVQKTEHTNPIQLVCKSGQKMTGTHYRRMLMGKTPPCRNEPAELSQDYCRRVELKPAQQPSNAIPKLADSKKFGNKGCTLCLQQSNNHSNGSRYCRRCESLRWSCRKKNVRLPALRAAIREGADDVVERAIQLQDMYEDDEFDPDQEAVLRKVPRLPPAYEPAESFPAMVKPSVIPKPVSIYSEKMSKACALCHITTPMSEFAPASSYCRDCDTMRNRVRQAGYTLTDLRLGMKLGVVIGLMPTDELRRVISNVLLGKTNAPLIAARDRNGCSSEARSQRAIKVSTTATPVATPLDISPAPSDGHNHTATSGSCDVIERHDSLESLLVEPSISDQPLAGKVAMGTLTDEHGQRAQSKRRRSSSCEVDVTRGEEVLAYGGIRADQAVTTIQTNGVAKKAKGAASLPALYVAMREDCVDEVQVVRDTGPVVVDGESDDCDTRTGMGLGDKVMVSA